LKKPKKKKHKREVECATDHRIDNGRAEKGKARSGGKKKRGLKRNYQCLTFPSEAFEEIGKGGIYTRKTEFVKGGTGYSLYV